MIKFLSSEVFLRQLFCYFLLNYEKGISGFNYNTSFPLDCFVFISLQLSKTPDGLYKCSAKVICHALRDMVPFLQFKKRKNTHGEHPPWVFSTFFKLYKWYQIAQNITYSLSRNPKNKMVCY